MTTTSGHANQPNGIFLVLGLLVAAIMIYIFYTGFIPSLWNMNPPSSGFDYLVN